MPLPTLAIPGFDGLSHTVNLANSGRQAAADSSAVVLSTEDLAAINAIVTALAGTLVVTANVGTGTRPVSGTITANAGTGTFAVSAASLPLPTGAATAAKQAALGTAGTAATDVLTVQGIASMTPLLSNITLLNGNAINLGAGAVGTGTLRITQASDSPLVTATGAVGDTAWASGSGSMVALLKTIAGAALDTTTLSPVKIDQTGSNNVVVNTPATTAYALIPAPSTYRVISAAATTNGANIKASAGAVKGIQGFNAKASAVYLKLYNKATGPTVGTDTPVKTIYLPATAAFALDFGTGIGFATGIGIALTGAGADADTTALLAGDILALNVDYH